MPTAAVYVRVSTDEQNKPGLASIPAQLEAARQYAAAHGLEVAKEYIDDFSGQSAKRPALDDLLAAKDQYQAIIVYDATRLARNIETARLLRRLFDTRLRLVHGDVSNMDEESALWMSSISDTAAHAEIVRLKNRSKLGREGRAKLGRQAGRLPAGWIAVRDPKGHTVGAEHDPACASFYADLERLFLEGCPYKSLGARLAALGHMAPERIISKTGEVRPPHILTVSALRWTLTNPMNRGQLIYRHTVPDAKLNGRERIVVENAFKPWWSDSDAVAAEFQRRLGVKGAARKHAHKLTGVLTCGGCGSRLVANPRHGHTYFSCGRMRQFPKNTSLKCDDPQSIREDRALQMIIDLFKLLPAWTDADWSGFLHNLNGSNGHEQEIAAASERLAVLEGEEKHLADNLAHLSGRAASTIRKNLQAVSEEIDVVRTRLTSLKSNRLVLPDRKSMLAALVKDIPQMEPAELQSLILKFAPRGLEVRNGIIPFLWELQDQLDSPSRKQLKGLRRR